MRVERRRSRTAASTGSATVPVGEVEVVGERVADHLRLLVDLLRHEVAVVALVGDEGAGGDLLARPRRPARPSTSRISAPVARQDDPVAVLEIGDVVGEGRERQRVGAEIHLAVAVADRERRARGGRRSAGRPRPRTGRRARRRRAAAAASRRPPRSGACPRRISLVTSCATTSVSVSVSKRTPSASSSAFSSRKFSMMPLWTTASRSVACGWALVSFGLPWVAQRVWPMPIVPASGACDELDLEVAQLALGAAALEVAVLQGGDAGRIVAAIFQPLQRLDDQRRDRRRAENSDDAAHAPQVLARCRSLRLGVTA